MKSNGLHLNLEDQKGKVFQQTLQKSISTDSSEIGSIYRNIEFLKYLDVYVFLKKRNKVVLSFQDGLSEDYASPVTKCVALEQIYSINSPYLVAPFSFTRNALQY